MEGGAPKLSQKVHSAIFACQKLSGGMTNHQTESQAIWRNYKSSDGITSCLAESLRYLADFDPIRRDLKPSDKISSYPAGFHAVCPFYKPCGCFSTFQAIG